MLGMKGLDMFKLDLFFFDDMVEIVLFAIIVICTTKIVSFSFRCNDFPCDFHWLPGPWEECTTSCGSNGNRQRQVLLK